MIPKFEMFRVKINDFTSLQSCAILRSNVSELSPKYLNMTSFGYQKFVDALKFN